MYFFTWGSRCRVPGVGCGVQGVGVTWGSFDTKTPSVRSDWRRQSEKAVTRFEEGRKSASNHLPGGPWTVGISSPTHAITITLTLTHTHTLSHSLTHSLSLTVGEERALSLSLYRFLSLPHSLTHTLTLSLILFLSLVPGGPSTRRRRRSGARAPPSAT